MLCSFSEAVLRYQQNGCLDSGIRQELETLIYFFPMKELKWPSEEAADYYFHVRPKLDQFLQRYKDEGRPFLHYLYSCLRYQGKDFRRKQARKRGDEKLALEESQRLSDDSYTQAEFLPAEVSEAPRPGYGPEKSRRRRILLSALRSVWYLRDHHLEGLSAAVGMSAESLNHLSVHLLWCLQDRIRRYTSLHQRRNQLWFFLHRCAERQHREVQPELREKLAETRRRYELQIQKLNRLMEKNIPVPTHFELAQYTGLAKGTVDSVLYTVRKKGL